jgi:hypothetical protein
MDGMKLEGVVRSQYLAALKMLKEAVVKCPDSMWDAPEDQDRVWFKAQHALYWTQRYLRSTDKEFVPGKLHQKPESGVPLAKSSVLEYLHSIEQQIIQNFGTRAGRTTHSRTGAVLRKLELHLVNIRHLQQHTGELYERIGGRGHIMLHWTEEVHGKPK